MILMREAFEKAIKTTGGKKEESRMLGIVRESIDTYDYFKHRKATSSKQESR